MSACQLSVLADLTGDFVHRRGPELLARDLPPKTEHVLLLRLAPAQQEMYQIFLQELRQSGNRCAVTHRLLEPLPVHADPDQHAQ